MSHQPVPAIDGGIQIPNQRFRINRITADSDITPKPVSVPCAEFQSHQTTLRETEHQRHFRRISTFGKNLEYFTENLPRSDNAVQRIFRDVVPAESVVVRVRSGKQEIVQRIE